MKKLTAKQALAMKRAINTRLTNNSRTSFLSAKRGMMRLRKVCPHVPVSVPRGPGESRSQCGICGKRL